MQRVSLGYQGSQVYLGTHSTLEQASLVHKIAKGKLTYVNGLKPSKAEVDSKIRIAKEAVSDALAGLGISDKEPERKVNNTDADDFE